MTLLPYALDFALVCFGAAILMNLWLVARGQRHRADHALGHPHRQRH